MFNAPDNDASIRRAVRSPTATVPPLATMTVLSEAVVLEGDWSARAWSAAGAAEGVAGIAWNSANAASASSAKEKNRVCSGTASKLKPLVAPASPVATLVMTWTQEMVREKSPWLVSRFSSAPDEGR